MNETCLFTDMDKEFLIYPTLWKTLPERNRKENLNCICSQFLLIVHIIVTYTGEVAYQIFVKNQCRGYFTVNSQQQIPVKSLLNWSTVFIFSSFLNLRIYKMMNYYFFKIKIISIQKLYKSVQILNGGLKTCQMKREKQYSKTLIFLFSLGKKCIMALIPVQDYHLNLSL